MNVHRVIESEFLDTLDYIFVSQPFSGGVTEWVYFNLKPCWEAWDVYMLNSEVLPMRSRHILRITFCFPTVPIPALGRPPAGSSPGLEKEGWPSPRPWLPLLIPACGWSHSLVRSWALRLLSLPSVPFCCSGLLHRPHAWLLHACPRGWCCSAPAVAKELRAGCFGCVLGFFFFKKCAERALPIALRCCFVVQRRARA